nr:hypothetical protein HK105_008313 [Polyrhizophydium stewartii]
MRDMRDRDRDARDRDIRDRDLRDRDLRDRDVRDRDLRDRDLRDKDLRGRDLRDVDLRDRDPRDRDSRDVRDARDRDMRDPRDRDLRDRIGPNGALAAGSGAGAGAYDHAQPQYYPPASAAPAGADYRYMAASPQRYVPVDSRAGLHGGGRGYMRYPDDDVYYQQDYREYAASMHIAQAQPIQGQQSLQGPLVLHAKPVSPQSHSQQLMQQPIPQQLQLQGQSIQAHQIMQMQPIGPAAHYVDARYVADDRDRRQYATDGYIIYDSRDYYAPGSRVYDRLADPGADPRMLAPRPVDGRFAAVPRLVDPRLGDPRLADTRMSEARYVDTRFSQPMAVDKEAASSDTRMDDRRSTTHDV